MGQVWIRKEAVSYSKGFQGVCQAPGEKQNYNVLKTGVEGDFKVRDKRFAEGQGWSVHLIMIITQNSQSYLSLSHLTFTVVWIKFTDPGKLSFLIYVAE